MEKRRNWWIWVSAVLAVAVVGLLVWGLSTKSDLDSAQQDLADAQAQLDSTKKKLDAAEQANADQEQQSTRKTVLTGGALAAGKAVYDELAAKLGATQGDLASTQDDLEAANARAEQAEKDAKAAEEKAKKAGNETDKAKAEAEQAQAELEAAQSRASVAAECAKAYVAAIGPLFEEENAQDAVRKQLAVITEDCRAALKAG